MRQGALGSAAVAPNGTGGALVAKYDPAGTFQWANSASGPPANPVPSIAAKCAVDAAGNSYLAGWYQTTTTFGTNVLQPKGSWSYFLAKLSTAAPSSNAPAITTQPVGSTNVTGTTATFTVASTGTAPLAYQWRLNGTNLTNAGDISGAATTTLALANVQTNQTGNYSVVVTNAYGTVTSSVAVLLVLPSSPAEYFTYTTNTGMITITAYTWYGGAVTIPSRITGLPVTSIGEGAFSSYYCAYLTSVTIPSSVTSIGGYPFAKCTSLTAITVDTLNASYCSVDGVLFDKGRTILLQCPGGKVGGVTMPSSVTSIESAAFGGCMSLTSVSIPSGVTNIGSSSSFSDCTRLKGVYFNGNAPTAGSSVFLGANDATVYYLPGTTGWGTTFCGRPTALWQPQAQTSDASFGVRTNRFGFNINWGSGRVVVVEACTNLVNPIWSPVGTNTLTNGWSYFSDPKWTNSPRRFYRLRSP